jgi:diacylglycerol kinase family enzyme
MPSPPQPPARSTPAASAITSSPAPACSAPPPASATTGKRRARGNGPLAWFGLARAVWRTLRRHRRLHLTLTIDGATHRLRTRALTITVNAVDNSADRPFGRTVLDGGRLWAYAERAHSPWQALRLLLHVATGSARDPALLQLSGSRIEVHTATPALRILIDGEPHLLATPLAFEIRPASLVVLAAA